MINSQIGSYEIEISPANELWRRDDVAEKEASGGSGTESGEYAADFVS